MEVIIANANVGETATDEPEYTHEYNDEAENTTPVPHDAQNQTAKPQVRTPKFSSHAHLAEHTGRKMVVYKFKMRFELASNISQAWRYFFQNYSGRLLLFDLLKCFILTGLPKRDSTENPIGIMSRVTLFLVIQDLVHVVSHE